LAYSYETFDGAAQTNGFGLSLSLLERVPPAEQLRLFKKEGTTVTELAAGLEWAYGGGTVELTSDLTATEDLIVLRETRGDRSYVQWVGAAYLRAADLDLYWRQRLHILQEIKELYEVAVLLEEGDSFEWPDKEDEGVEFTVDSNESTTHDVSQIRDLQESELLVDVTVEPGDPRGELRR